MVNVFPIHQLEPAVMVLNQCGTTLHPVTVVHVCDAVHLFDLWRVYVSTYHTFVTPGLAVLGQVFLELEHEVHGLLDVVLEELAHAPVLEAHPLADPVVPRC